MTSDNRQNFQSFKLRRIFQRDKVANAVIKGQEPEGYRYIIMELPWERAKIMKAIYEQQIRHIKDILKIKPYDPESDAETFAQVFNTILMTSPDPYRPITGEEAKLFAAQGTFLAYLYGQPAGFAALTKEESTEGIIGVIAGIGVMPKFRGKKVALAMAVSVIDWFIQAGVQKLQCEVYEYNDVSYHFISSLGFYEVGEMYLGKEQAEKRIIDK